MSFDFEKWEDCCCKSLFFLLFWCCFSYCHGYTWRS